MQVHLHAIFFSINRLESFLEIWDNLKNLTDEPCSLETEKKILRYIMNA